MKQRISSANIGLLSFLLAKPDRRGIFLDPSGSLQELSAQECARILIERDGVAAISTAVTRSAELSDADRQEIARFLDGAEGQRISFIVMEPALGSLGLRMLLRLARKGLESALTKAPDGSWERVDLQSGVVILIWQSLVQLLRQKYLELRRQRIIFARKACLKFLGTSLPELGVGSYVPDSGFGYVASVPALASQSDGPVQVLNDIALFEEHAPLYPHYAHDAIREQGQGRYSLWNGAFFFSSTDNSDPNTNGRRYRILKFAAAPWPIKWLLALPTSYYTARYSSDSSLPPREQYRASRLSGAVPLNLPKLSQPEVSAVMAKSSDRIYKARPNSVTLLITNLGAGGAERQLTYLALDLKRRGVSVNVISFESPEPITRHHVPLLERAGIPIAYLPQVHPDFNLSEFATQARFEDLRLSRSLPEEFSPMVEALYTHLVVDRPEVLHCWLDMANIVGGLGGLLAGVPRVILSSRSLNSTNFPGIHRPWFHSWYQTIMQNDRVRWIANSSHGGASYADWIGFKRAYVSQVSNGVDFSLFGDFSAGDIARTRAKYGLKDDECVIISIMRLSQEKHPQRFIRLIHELRKLNKSVKGLLVGAGGLNDLVQWELDHLKMGEGLQWLGIQGEVQHLIAASDIVALTSDNEGFPNVLIEGKAMGKAVVSTAVGGACDIIRDGIDGFLADRAKFSELRAKTLQLVENPELRKQFGQRGQVHAREAFNIERMSQEMLQNYGFLSGRFEHLEPVPYELAGNVK